MSPTDISVSNLSPPIATVEVEALFGKFSYRVELFTSQRRNLRQTAQLFAAKDDRLTLIYGRNGSGKTTLMQLLYHAVSSADNRGHRSALYNIRFERLTVALFGGGKIEYTKDETVPPGHMRCLAEIDGRRTEWFYAEQAQQPVTLVESAGGTITYDPRLFQNQLATPGFEYAFNINYEPPERAFIRELVALSINPVLLTDARVLESDVTEQPGTDRREVVTSRGGAQVDRFVEQQRDIDVADALVRVQRYLTQLVLAGSQRGTERADTIYTDLVKAIVDQATSQGRPPASTIPNLIARIEAVGQRAEPFTRHRLIPAPPVRPLIRSLSKAQAGKGRVLEQILTPYLESVEQRMEALDAGLKAISSYVDTLNSFLEGKRVSFRAPTGVAITDDTSEEVLSPQALSSGEKQILLLFSDVMALRDTTRLFIIDEPELSLDPNWQRRLVPALLSVTEGSAMQIVAATHSIELMAKYRSRIKRLELSASPTEA